MVGGSSGGNVTVCFASNGFLASTAAPIAAGLSANGHRNVASFTSAGRRASAVAVTSTVEPATARWSGAVASTNSPAQASTRSLTS